MELHHAFTVPAPVDRTWETFMDLQGVGGCFPGATVTQVDGDSFDGTCKVKLGPIVLVYAGSGTVVERDDDGHRALIEAMGKDKRGNGTAGATVRVVLVADGDGTAVDVTTDLIVTGKPAQFGRGVMQDVSDKLLGQFVACLEQRFVESQPGDAATETSSAETASGRAADPSDSEPPTSATGSREQAPPAQVATVAEVAADGERVTSPAASPAPRPAPLPAPQSAPRSAPRPGTEPAEALDLGATVLPVLLKTYGPYLLGALVGTALGLLIGRRRS